MANDARPASPPYAHIMPAVLATSLAVLPIVGTIAPLAWFARTSRRPASSS